MMIGNVKWNMSFAAIGTTMTFIFSWMNNPLWTALLRSLYCFIILFVFMFALRMFLGFLTGSHRDNSFLDAMTNTEDGLGSHVDQVTPDEDEQIKQALKENLGEASNAATSADDFAPLQPKRLKLDGNPERWAKAVTQMSDDEGR